MVGMEELFTFPRLYPLDISNKICFFQLFATLGDAALSRKLFVFNLLIFALPRITQHVRFGAQLAPQPILFHLLVI